MTARRDTGVRILHNALLTYFAVPVRRAKRSPELQTEARKGSNALQRAKRTAAKLGVTIERDRQGGYWVGHPDLDDTPADPCDGEHFCLDGGEVEQAVDAYVEHFARAAA